MLRTVNHHYQHDVITAILISKTVNGGHTGVQVFELFSCVDSFFCSDKSTYLLNSRMKTSYKPVVVSRLKPLIVKCGDKISLIIQFALSFAVKALI